MTKQEFWSLFKAALESAARSAEARVGHPVSRNFQILLYGAGCAGILMNPLTAVEKLYLGDKLFYRIIDVGVVEANEDCTKVFVRASDHSPGAWDQTWNQPVGSGPFKQLGTAENVIGG